MVRTLRPYHANISKRQVKAPKVYVADSGILHTLLDIQTARDLEGHPKVGASWEGFLLETVVARLGARPDQCYFWATHAGAELDLLIVDGSRRRGFEFKRTPAPIRSRSVPASTLSRQRGWETSRDAPVARRPYRGHPDCGSPGVIVNAF